MPADMTAADLPAESGLRWMGEIPVENKYDPYYGLDVPEWARLEDGNIQLAVRFYEDVPSNEHADIMSEYSANFTNPIDTMPWIYEIITSENNITTIVSNDGVMQVSYIGSKMVPIDDNSPVDTGANTIIDDSLEEKTAKEILESTENASSNENKESPGFSLFITVGMFIPALMMLLRK